MRVEFRERGKSMGMWVHERRGHAWPNWAMAIILYKECLIVNSKLKNTNTYIVAVGYNAAVDWSLSQCSKTWWW